MNQYTPVIQPDSRAARKFPELLVRPSNQDYEELLDYADSLGIEDYFWQDGEAAKASFIPPFDYTGL
jgi:putative pyruvate formate lyase activating enzyme